MAGGKPPQSGARQDGGSWEARKVAERLCDADAWGDDDALEEEGELGGSAVGLAGRSQVCTVKGMGCSHLEGGGTNFPSGCLLPSSPAS